MPVNPDIHFQKAQERYEKARDPLERLLALREMLSTAPTHKGAETLRGGIKKKISKLLDEQERAKKGKGRSRDPFAVRKETEFNVAVVGFTNSGKSWLLNELTNAKPEMANYEFTTTRPISGIMKTKGAKVQLIEIPSFFDSKSLGTIRGTDAIALIIDVTKDKKEQEKKLKKILEEARIDKPIILIKTKTGREKAKELKEKLFHATGAIRVFTRSQWKEPDFDDALVVKKGTTVIGVCSKIHKDFAKNLKYAKVWGSSKFPGQRVANKYKLKDGDVIEIYA
ncbi:MAG: TGS domain-containing protein [Candidatus Diapherotrites archaeon]|nr:TGS domain-containing protein [Candidatus Diapherotrites archaeon]